MNLDVDFLERHWPLSGTSIDPAFESYPSRHVIPVRSEQGSYVAKVGSKAAAERATSVLTFLEKRGFDHSPKILSSRDGDFLVHHEEAVYLMDHVSKQIDPDPRSWMKVGAAAAQLNAIEDFPSRFAIPVDAALSEVTTWVDGRHFASEFSDLLPRLGELDKSSAAGLIHGELNPANIRERSDGAVVFVDWDQAGTGPLALELGYPLITVFVSENQLAFDHDAARAFYDGYQEAGGVLEPPRQIYSAALFHAFRYMRFGDVNRRWERIKFALTNERDLVGPIGGTSP